MTDIDSIMRTAPVIPVLVIEEVEHARPIAEALVSGGLPVLEVTLRTPAALQCLIAMAEVEGAIVGAGTVTSDREFRTCVDAGAHFIVSPGLTDPVAKAARETGIPFLPGVATAGDIMRGLDHGLDHFKFFPAEAAGGLKALSALAAPFHKVRFCPTGGITPQSAPDWLAHPSVLCVGGSWLVPKGKPDATTIWAAACTAAALRQPG